MNLKLKMNAADTSAKEPDQQSGITTGGKCGLWTCGGCAFVLAVAIVVSGVLAARWLTNNPETLSKLYGEQPTPQILIQPGGLVRMLSDEWMMPMSVAWSPDGQRIAICATPNVSMRKFLGKPPPMVIDPCRQEKVVMKWAMDVMGPRVAVIDLATGEERIIHEGSSDTARWPYDVVWFPDGEQLVVGTGSSFPDGSAVGSSDLAQLWVVNADGGGLRKLADGVRFALVSPDARWIACRQPTDKHAEALATVLDADDGSEVWTCQKPSSHAVWDSGGNILYFFSYGTEENAGGCRKVELPSGKATTVEMKEVQVSRPSRLTAAHELSVSCHGGAPQDEEERTYRLRVRDFTQGHYWYLTPSLNTPFGALGVCLDGRYVLVGTREVLWAYRLADGKFYQVTDPASLDLGWRTELDPSGTKVCLVGSLPEEDIFRIFTTGLSMPVMILQLDEERILSQPGYDAPVLPSSDDKGEDK